MWEIIKESAIDSIKMLPFLMGAYILIEYLERGAGRKMKDFLSRLRLFGPVGGALLGLIPQCGFSVAAANFYSKKLITTGTLMSVFIATSDEAIPVLIANPGNGALILRLLGVKLIMAVFFGTLIDLILSRTNLERKGAKLAIEEEEAGRHDCSCCGKQERGILFTAFMHSMKILVLVFFISIVLNYGLHFLGEEPLSVLLMENSVFQPFLAGLLGLIPSCASSVILAELYLKGGLSFGSVVAGLSTGAGMGLIVLFKENRSRRENLLIIVSLYAIGVVAGLAAAQVIG